MFSSSFLSFGKCSKFSSFWILVLVSVFSVFLSISDVLRHRIPLGLDLRGGVRMVLEIDSSDIEHLKKKSIHELVNQAIEIIGKRVNELGISEVVIQKQGINRINVEIPGMNDISHARDMIGKTATLNFNLVETERNHVSSKNISEYSIYEYQGSRFLIKKQSVLEGNRIINAKQSMSGDGKPSVSVLIDKDSANQFSKVTSQNIGKPMAVIYRETYKEGKLIKTKEEIISIAIIRDSLGDSFEISGLSDVQHAKDLAILLRSGSLSAPVTIIEESLIGPNSGKQNVFYGILSILVGFLISATFMCIYYRISGIVACIATIFNMSLLLNVLHHLGIVLSLPGIAGAVLTTGISIDSCVLIYERIKDEIRSKSTIRMCIKNGYKKAISAILDANIVNIMSAIIMASVSSGPIRGFAIVLLFGIISSVSVSLIYTKCVLTRIYSQSKNISI